MAILNEDERALVVAAIEDAERGNRGEVRLHLERWCLGGGAMARAEQLFHRLGMTQTQQGTGVVLYVAVRSRRAAVFAGPGVFAAAAGAQWASVVEAVRSGYRRDQGVAGIIEALECIGDLLRQVVPGEDDAGDELTDAVSES